MFAVRTSILATFTSLTRELIISSVSFPRSAEKFSSFSLPCRHFFFGYSGIEQGENAPTMKPHNRTRTYRSVRAPVFFLLHLLDVLTNRRLCWLAMVKPRRCSNRRAMVFCVNFKDVIPAVFARCCT